MMRFRKDLTVCFVLAALTVAAYSICPDLDFVSYDDDLFITKNPRVQQGLTSDNIRWAMVSEVAANWHPVTMLSHMADVSLFGMNPGAHHVVNLAFHTINVLLLYALLRMMTSKVWRCALVAGLFAIHPLHVESVAWIAERKDLLSTFFFLLTLIAYVIYTRRPSGQRRRIYVTALLLYALGLMSKPMIVTLPAVIILLDYWPLGRMKQCAPLRALLLEKVPFALLAIADSLITLLVQKTSGTVISMEATPLALRAQNAIVTVTAYLQKVVWLRDLAVFYPYPTSIAPTVLIAAVAIIVGITFLAWRWRAHRPYLIAGWLWYLVTLLPVIGLIQVGNQSMADRYTYIPLIGIFIAIAWLLADWALRSAGEDRHASSLNSNFTTISSRPANAAKDLRRWIAAGGASLVLVVLARMTFTQAGHWRDSGTLFAHADSVTTGNWVAWDHLATWHAQHGKYRETIRYSEALLRVQPRYANGHLNLGIAFMRVGDYGRAMTCFKSALRLDPKMAQAHNNLGVIYASLGRAEQAAHHFSAAVEADPANAEWRANLDRANALLHTTPAAPPP